MDFHKTSSLQFLISFILFIMLPQWTSVAGWSYHHSDKTMDWNTARQWCRDHFTDMVAIQNHNENTHLNSNLSRVNGYYWIGIRKINDTWTWVGTNKTAKFENWAEGEPNNGRNDEACVEIYIKREKDEGKWNDELCTMLKTALCYAASCKKDSCSYHGECVETINNHTCECFEGFYGKECEHVVKCKAEEISAPDHGSVHCVHLNGNFSYDSQCQYSCNEGYQVAGSQTTQCKASAAWSTKPPTCEPIRCKLPDVRAHLNIKCRRSSDDLTVNSTCYFSCDAGFELQGVASTNCTNTGEWNTAIPGCTAVKCKAEEISAPDHGSVHCVHPSGNFSYDSQCEYSCNEGYQVVGSQTTQCKASAAWSTKPPTCEPAPCKTPSVLGEGKMNCVKGNSTFCTVECPPGHLLLGTWNLTCQCDGLWSDFRPLCIRYDHLLLASMVCSVLSTTCYCILCCSLCRKRKKTVRRAQEAVMNPAYQAGDAELENPLRSV